MECATRTFFILFDKARKRWMSCINSIWVTKIGIDGLNGEDCSREGKTFLVYYFYSRIPDTSSFWRCSGDITNTKAVKR